MSDQHPQCGFYTSPPCYSYTQLSPRHWHNTKENIPSLIHQFEQQLNANIFQPYQYKIQSRAVKILLEQNKDTGTIIDKSLNEECDDLFFLYAVYCNKHQNIISLYFTWMSASNVTESRANL